MVLIATARQVNQQLRQVLAQLLDSQYAEPLPVLSGNTIGKHTRHILEFYDCLMRQRSQHLVNYDLRQRDLQLEESVAAANQKLQELDQWLSQLDSDAPLKLEAAYAEGHTTAVETTLFRELAYNIEHTIHHLAILKIALQNHFQEVALPADFGVAYSTVQHQQSCAQ